MCQKVQENLNDIFMSLLCFHLPLTLNTQTRTSGSGSAWSQFFNIFKILTSKIKKIKLNNSNTLNKRTWKTKRLMHLFSYPLFWYYDTMHIFEWNIINRETWHSYFDKWLIILFPNQNDPIAQSEVSLTHILKWYISSALLEHMWMLTRNINYENLLVHFS